MHSGRTISMAAAINEALDVALDIDPAVFLIGEDIADPAGGVFKVSKGLSTKYGTDRVRATPIAEQAIIGAAIGSAMLGFRPVAEIMFFDFIAVAMDQVVNHAAKLRYMSAGHTTAPLTIRTTVGTARFGAQHAQSLESWFMHTPGLNVVYPATPADARGLMLSSIFSDDPTLFIEHTGMLFTVKGEVPDGDVRIPLGQAEVKRAGTDLTIVTYGSHVHLALAAADELAEEGTSVEVVDLRTLSPMDTDTVLASIRRTGRCLITHQATRSMGPGAEIAAIVTEGVGAALHAPIVRLGGEFVPVPFSPGLTAGPTSESLAAAARELAGS